MPSRSAIVVRPVRRSDQDDLRETYFQLYEERDAGEPIGITLFETRPSREDEDVWFEALLRRVESGEEILLVAEVDGHAVGSCSVHRVGASPASEQAHTGELGILVRRGMRGQGVGTALLERTLAEARSRFEVVYLSVFAINTGAQRLYRRFGFRKCGTLPRAVKRRGQYLDEVRMALLVGSSPVPVGANR